MPRIDRALDGVDALSSVACWKERTLDLLSKQECVFHRNGEISAVYAALYLRRPELYKWAGMAAFASHHARLALFPMRLDADASGAVDVPRALRRWFGLHMHDIDAVRQTNNGIFEDACWVHLAYDGHSDGLERIHGLQDSSDIDPGLLQAFVDLERGRGLLASGDLSAEDVIWAANLEILRHEQRVLVQPHFDTFTPAFARAFSLGAGFGIRVHGIARSIGLFTSFLGFVLTRGLGATLRSGRLPLVTRFTDRWRWIEGAILPRFRRFEKDRAEMTEAMEWIIADATRRSSEIVCDARVMR